MEIVEIVPGFVAEVQGVDLRREVGTGFGDAVTASLDQWPVTSSGARTSTTTCR